jgi:CP family cyanate transporter-like MFS transporter
VLHDGAACDPPPVNRGRFLAALFIAAFVLRPQLVGIGPLLPAIEDDLSVSHAVAGLLATIPVLCMGLFALPARHLAARIGSRAAVSLAVAFVGVFGVVRAVSPGVALDVLLTFPIGIGMGLAGGILPVVVKERFADRPGFATGVYAGGITIGAAVAAAVAVPLAHAAGGWRTPLWVFGGVSIALALLWIVLTRDELPHVRADAPRPLRLPFRSAVAWRLVASFFFMSSVFYGLNAWLPDVYVDRGWSERSAGALLAILNAITIPIGFVVAWVADHRGTRQRWLTAAAALQLAAILGVIFLPGAGWAWAVALGFAIGPLFPLTMTLPLDVTGDPAEVGAIAAMMLGIGYTCSAAAPLLLGVVRDQAGGFGPVLWCLAGAAAALAVVDGSLRLGRAHHRPATGSSNAAPHPGSALDAEPD